MCESNEGCYYIDSFMFHAFRQLTVWNFHIVRLFEAIFGRNFSADYLVHPAILFVIFIFIFMLVRATSNVFRKV